MKLTARKCHQVPAGIYPDDQAPGLRLIVGAGGGRSWVQRIQVAGRRRDLGLGPLVEVPILHAREHAVENQARARMGLAPRSWRDRRKSAAEATGEPLASIFPNVRALAETYAGVQVDAGRWKRPYADKWLRLLATHGGARLLATPCDEVTPGTVIDRCIAALRADRHRTAQDLRRGLHWAFSVAVARGYRPDNPAGRDVLAMLPMESQTGQRRRMRAVAWQDAPAVAARVAEAAAGEVRRGSSVALCLLAIVVTACRTAEAREMRWSEIDLEAGIWTVPASRMKTGHEHTKPISGALRAVLEEARQLNPETELVFPSARRDRPFAEAMMSRLSAELHLGCSPHGWRATFRTWAGEHAYPREEAEIQLAHAVGSRVEQAYFRGDLFERRRPMMDAWGAYVLGAARLSA